MQARSAALAALLGLCAVAPGQEQPRPSPAPAPEAKPAQAVDTTYANPELGLSFSGVYGWSAKVASASGAWNELARYESDASNDSYVLLLVRDNPFGTLSELRTALGVEFKETAEPAPGRPAFKEMQFREVEMRKGINLPGIEVEGVAVEVKEDGKKRERSLLLRTYYGQNRLFRVYCSAPRARLKRVRDLFERAVSGLSISAVEEKTVRGIPFRSVQGLYACTVPEGFGVVRPPDASLADARFEMKGIVISVISAPYDGSLADQTQELADYYRDTLKMEEQTGSMAGSEAFLGTVTKPDSVTYIMGTVKDRRVYRVHTAAPPKRAAEAKKVHEEFVKGFRIGRQS
ncbi:MAG TPA: hypothetical protein VFY93_09730 [Planctomycetota bacterium]|nr:hypothetical protein [Planctomycetota bacterium]